MWIDIALALAGLVIVTVSAERAVPALLGTASGLGASVFLLSVVLLGFDLENLAVGATAGLEGSAGLALGTILGSAMVAVALALGITAMIVPLKFHRVPKRILALPVAAAALLWALAADGRLSRIDGAILLSAYAAAVFGLLALSRRGVDVEGLDTAKRRVGAIAERRGGPLRSAGYLLLALAGLAIGSELLVRGAQDLIAAAGLSETVIGMSVIALAVSIEEVGRELPAAWRGHPEIALGNVVGSVFAFFLFNAGVIALIRPLPIDDLSRSFYLPAAIATVVLLCGLLSLNRLTRAGGAILILVYAAFVAGGGLLAVSGP